MRPKTIHYGVNDIDKHLDELNRVFVVVQKEDRIKFNDLISTKPWLVLKINQHCGRATYSVKRKKV